MRETREARCARCSQAAGAQGIEHQEAKQLLLACQQRMLSLQRSPMQIIFKHKTSHDLRCQQLAFLTAASIEWCR